MIQIVKELSNHQFPSNYKCRYNYKIDDSLSMKENVFLAIQQSTLDLIGKFIDLSIIQEIRERIKNVIEKNKFPFIVDFYILNDSIVFLIEEINQPKRAQREQ